MVIFVSSPDCDENFTFFCNFVWYPTIPMNREPYHVNWTVALGDLSIWMLRPRQTWGLVREPKPRKIITAYQKTTFPLLETQSGWKFHRCRYFKGLVWGLRYITPFRGDMSALSISHLSIVTTIVWYTGVSWVSMRNLVPVKVTQNIYIFIYSFHS